MSLRPSGTDGSDHEYRETIERAYKILVRTRKWTGFFTYASILPGLVRGIWYIGGNYLGGLTLNYPAAFMLVCHILAVVAWILARVGTSKESFAWVRIAASLHLMWFAVLITSGYRYHNILEDDLHVDTRLYMYLKQAHGITGDHVWKVLSHIDHALDVLLFVKGCLLFGNMHPYVMVQINLKKRAESIEEEASKGREQGRPQAKPAPAAKESASKPSPSTARPEAGGARRRTGRA